MLVTPPSVAVEPPLQPAEARFIAGFARRGAVCRVWPGQPSSRSPWCPSEDGRRLVLDVELAAASPDTVASWLRFLDRSFLAPSTTAALAAALAHGLRTGHQLVGTVCVDQLEVSVDRHHVEERTRRPETEAVVLDLGARLGLRTSATGLSVAVPVPAPAPVTGAGGARGPQASAPR